MTRLRAGQAEGGCQRTARLTPCPVSEVSSPGTPLTVSREKRGFWEDCRRGLKTSMEALRVAVALRSLTATTGLLATRTRSSSGREPGRTLAICNGAGGGQGNGGGGSLRGQGGRRVGDQCSRRRWLTWGMSGRRADVDSEMLSGTCRNGTGGVSDQEGLCKAHAGLGWTPPTNTSTR